MSANSYTEATYTEEYIYNSNHSYVRAKERVGLNRKKAERMIDRARKRGIGYEKCTWSLDRKYLSRRSDETTKALAYNGFCFIFDRESLECITIIPLPRHFGKKKTFYPEGRYCMTDRETA